MLLIILTSISVSAININYSLYNASVAWTFNNTLVPVFGSGTLTNGNSVVLTRASYNSLYDGGTSAGTFPTTTSRLYSTAGAISTTYTSFYLSVWVNSTNANTTDTRYIFVQDQSSPGGRIYIRWKTDGTTDFLSEGGGVNEDVGNANSSNDGTWKHWIFTAKNGGNQTIYKNGRQINSTVMANNFGSTRIDDMGLPGLVPGWADVPTQGIYIDEAILGYQYIDATQALALYQAYTPYSLTYSNNLTSGTTVSTNVTHSLLWNSSLGLSNYIFSWCNNTYLNVTIAKTPVLYNFTKTSTMNATGNITGGNTSWVSSFARGVGASPYLLTTINRTDGLWYNYTSIASNANPWIRIEANITFNTDYTIMNVSINNASKFLSAGSEVGTCYIANYTGAVWESFAVLTTTPTYFSVQYTNNKTIYDHINKTTGKVSIQCIGALFDATESVRVDYFEVKTSSNTTANNPSCTEPNAVLTNDTSVSFGGLTNFSNTSKLITSTIGATVKWCYYATDLGGNINSTSCVNPFSYITTATVAPTVTLNATNTLSIYGDSILYGYNTGNIIFKS